MFCTSCGTKNTGSSRFCKECGKELERAQSARISEEQYDSALPEDEQVGLLLERAYQLRKAGKVDAAIVACEDALRVRSDSTSVHALLAQLCEMRGDTDRAISELSRVLELNPGSIADRVRLDRLRGDAPTEGAGSQRILVSHSERSGWVPVRIAALVASAAVICVLLGVAVAQLRPGRAAPARSATASGQAGPAIQAAQLPAVQPHSVGGASQQVADSRMSSQAATSGFQTPGLPIASPIWYPAGPGEVQRTAPQLHYRADASAPTRRAAPPAGLAAPDKNRIRLPAEGGPGSEIIRVGPTPVAQDSPGANGSEGAGSIRISVSDSKDGDAQSGQPASTDSVSRILQGDSSKLKGEYGKARQAYQMALSGAGDRTAYVYQQIAECFQSGHDDASAVTNYGEAIKAYNCLVARGVDVDSARAGIRVCKSGIRICSH